VTGVHAPSFSLDGLAVVTGAAGGLGSACSRALADAGAEVALLGRSPEPLHALAREIADAGGRARALPCDVTDAAQVEAAFAALPAPAALVTCAGGNRPAPFVDVSPADLDWALRLNVRGAYLPAQAAVRRMLAAGLAGAIVHVTSQMGHVGAALRTAYCAAKHAVEGLTKAMAVELAPHGIRVNAVAPTFVETPMTTAFLAGAAGASIRRQIPLGRLGEADEVAAAVLFALAPAASLMTGASLRVDGGWTAQ
jgi:NAD(P)-dependent dehydrogenase (short-subunit alcohol dehydrogenase family)